MVQTTPAGWEQWSDFQVYAFLRGFVPGQATPDPAVLAQMQMMQPAPAPQPPAAVEAAQAPMPAPAPAATIPQKPSEQPVTLVLLYGKGRQVLMVGLDMSLIAKGAVIRFRRDGNPVLDACVKTVSSDRVVCDASSQEAIKDGDSITVLQGGM